MRSSPGATVVFLSAGAGVLVAAILAGGPYRVPVFGPSGGGGGVFPSGGGFRVASTLGASAQTAMSGGGYSMSPGVIAAQRAASTDLGGAHAFPVPFVPSRGHNKITFTRLMPKVTIRVYTVSGEEVRVLHKDSAGADQLVWFPVTNDKGQAVASGVYIYVVESSDGHKNIGKLMVIK
ncbi:MAG: hypothetical protein ABII00_02895 [Elusimicrobiota bacterium]